jgi:hypothetical protein
MVPTRMITLQVKLNIDRNSVFYRRREVIHKIQTITCPGRNCCHTGVLLLAVGGYERIGSVVTRQEATDRDYCADCSIRCCYIKCRTQEICWVSMLVVSKEEEI